MVQKKDFYTFETQTQTKVLTRNLAIANRSCWASYNSPSGRIWQ